MKTFLALYRGETVASASLLAVSADPDLVFHVATRLLANAESPGDPVLQTLQRGRRGALRAVKREAQAEQPAAEILRLLKHGNGPQETGHDR